MPYRNLDKLDPAFRAKVELFLKEAKPLGVFITESYRSPERQKELYAQGRTTPGNKVTWTLKSEHMKGTAIDIAFQADKYGTLYPNDAKLWGEVFAIAEKYGINSGYLLWGRDKPHLQNNPNHQIMADKEEAIYPDWADEGVKWANENKIITKINGEPVSDYRLAVILHNYTKTFK